MASLLELARLVSSDELLEASRRYYLFEGDYADLSSIYWEIRYNDPIENKGPGSTLRIVKKEFYKDGNGIPFYYAVISKGRYRKRPLGKPRALANLEIVFDTDIEVAHENISLPEQLFCVLLSVIAATKRHSHPEVYLNVLLFDYYKENRFDSLSPFEQYRECMRCYGIEINEQYEIVKCYDDFQEIVRVESRITSVAPNAFLNCSSVKEVLFEDGVTDIGSHAFYGCTNLERVVLPKTLRSIGNYAFSGCPNLKEIVCESVVLNHIGAMAFDCNWVAQQNGFVSFNGILVGYVATEEIDTLDIPEGITAIVDDALFLPWESMAHYQAISIPSSIRVIGENAFRDFHNATVVDLGHGLLRVGTLAFGYIDRNVSIIGGDNVTFVGEDAFPEEATFESANPVLNKAFCTYSQFERRVEIADGVKRIEKLKVSKDDADVIYIPGSVLAIPDSAIGPGIVIETPIWSYARFYAESHSIPVYAVIEDDERFVPYGSYRSIKKVLNLQRFDCVKKIVYDARKYCDCEDQFIEKCPNIDGYLIDRNSASANYKVIDGALYGNGGLTLLRVPPMREGFFAVPEGVRNIDMYAFLNSQVSEVRLPSSLVGIDEDVFVRCPNLKEIYIPAGVSVIGDQRSFDSPIVACPNLENIYVDPDNSCYFSLDGVLYGADKNSLVAYPTGRKGPFKTPQFVRLYALGAFRGCTGLTGIELSSEVTDIDRPTFVDCSGLKAITLPKKIDYCDITAFCGCHALKDIYLQNPNLEFELDSYGADYLRKEVVNSIGEGKFTIHATGRPAASFAKVLGVDVSVTISDSEEIKEREYCDLTNLVSVQLVDGLRTIGASAFEGCTDLREVTIPKSVGEIRTDAFKGCNHVNLCVYRGSAAEQYAEDHGIPYVVID